MHLRTVFQCVPCDQRSSLVRDFFLFVCIMSMRVGHSILATSRVCHTHDCRFLDFRVRRFDNKLQVAFDRVRCWFVEVPFFPFFLFFLFQHSLDWLSWESITEFENFISKTSKKLLHKSHQLLRNSIFVSQKLLFQKLTANSSLLMYPGNIG